MMKITDEKLKDDLKNIMNAIVEKSRKETIEEFDDRFPKLIESVNKYSENSPSEIQFWVNHERNKLNNGSEKLYKELKNITSNDKKINWAIAGILDGDLYYALDIACNRYTDMTRKHFLAVYKHITTGEVIKTYKEYTKEEITKWYSESDWAKKDFKTLDDCLKAYVGKPKMSLERFKTSQDIIDWFYNIQNLYDNICKADIDYSKFLGDKDNDEAE